jgi:hypothetical protein
VIFAQPRILITSLPLFAKLKKNRMTRKKLLKRPRKFSFLKKVYCIIKFEAELSKLLPLFSRALLSAHSWFKLAWRLFLRTSPRFSIHF